MNVPSNEPVCLILVTVKQFVCVIIVLEFKTTLLHTKLLIILKLIKKYVSRCKLEPLQ